MTSVAVGTRSPGLRSPVLSASAAVLMNIRMIATRTRIDINDRWRARFPERYDPVRAVATRQFRPHVMIHETV